MRPRTREERAPTDLLQALSGQYTRNFTRRAKRKWKLIVNRRRRHAERQRVAKLLQSDEHTTSCHPPQNYIDRRSQYLFRYGYYATGDRDGHLLDDEKE